MKIGQIMSHNVECISPTTPIAVAAQTMRDLDIGFLAICEHDHLAGTLTDRDITIRSVAQGRDPRLATVQEIMTPEVFYCYDDDDVEQVSRRMQESEVKRMLILDRDRRLVGVVSLGDIAKTSGASAIAGETLADISEAA